MTEDVSYLILEHLKHIRGKVDVMALDVMDLKSRMTGMEVQMGQVQVSLAGQSQRIDRMDERLSRIERRVDLVDA